MVISTILSGRRQPQYVASRSSVISQEVVENVIPLGDMSKEFWGRRLEAKRMSHRTNRRVTTGGGIYV